MGECHTPIHSSLQCVRARPCLLWGLYHNSAGAVRLVPSRVHHACDGCQLGEKTEPDRIELWWVRRILLGGKIWGGGGEGGDMHVCMEEKDLKEGLFKVSDLEEAAKILVPQDPKKLKELGLLPSRLLTDFTRAICSEYVEERKDLIKAIPKDRKLSDIPKNQQPTLIIWGEGDKVFPLEMGHRLKRHLGESAQLIVIKNAGHAFDLEKPKEFHQHLKSFLGIKRKNH